MRQETFNALMKVMASYFGPIGGDKLDDDDADKLIALYCAGLMDLPDGAIELAVDEAIKRCKFWPKICELREFAARFRATNVTKERLLYNPNQIEEFTVQRRQEAKESLDRLMNGLGEWSGDQPPELVSRVVKANSDLSAQQFESRRRLLQQQFQQLGVSR